MSEAKSDVKSEEFDDLGPVLDDEGRAVPDEDVLLAAEKIEVVTIRLDGLTYKVKAQRGRVPFDLDERRNALELSLLFEAGYTAADFEAGGALNRDDDRDESNEGTGEAEPTEKNNEKSGTDPREAKYLELRATSPEFRAARAAIAAAATVATNVPQLRGKTVTAAGVLALPRRLGDAYIKEVGNFMRRSLPGLAADAEKKSADAGTGPSATMPVSTKREKSRATS